MKALTVYRILTYILLPIAAFFGCMGVLMVLPALANPPFLLVVFIFACIVIYTFSSLQFLQKGIDANIPRKPSLKDWIRVNAYVCLAAGVMFLINSIGIFSMGPNTMEKFVTETMQQQPNLPANINPAFFVSVLKFAAGLMLFVSLVLLSHIILGFKLLKQYQHLFNGAAS